ncbi:MAG: hypothetical protein MJ076_00710 [Clostridia bacterium]|nr:hypothetical protein [Clostridia bacterium]
MKKAIAVILCVIMVISLCSCKKVKVFDSFLSDTSQIIDDLKAKADDIIIKGYPAIDQSVNIEQPEQQIENPIVNEANQKISTPSPSTVKEVPKQPLCYDCLNKEQSRIYRILLTVADEMTTGWISLGRCKQSYVSDVSVAYRALTNDYPEFFWLPNSYFLGNTNGHNSQVLIAFCYHNGNDNCDYLIKKEDKNQMTDELNNVVSKIVDGAKKYENNFEKQLYIHDTICEITTYNTTDSLLVYTSYGALVSGKAVCEGYSRAMQLICSKIGIPCAVVFGDAQGEGHMWNVVNVDGDWYHLDVTWDDSGSDIYHTYFNVCDSEILESHTEYDTYIPQIDETFPKEEKYNLLSYVCDSTNLNYFTYNNAFLDKSCNLSGNTISSEYLKGKNYAQLKITDSSLLSELNITYTPYLAKLQLRLNKLSGNSILLKSISITNNIVTLYW